MKILSKFIVGSELGIDLLFELKEIQLREMYKNDIDSEKLTVYIEDELDRRTAINQLNDFTTQLIMVFGDDQPLGYAIVKNSYERPSVLKDKKAVQLFLYILPEFHKAEVFQSLWQKCQSVMRNCCSWTEILQNDPLLSTLESWGFTILQESKLQPFNLDSYILLASEPSVL